jgi:hypothetical protein
LEQLALHGTEFVRALYLFRHAERFRTCDRYSWSPPQVSGQNMKPRSDPDSR